MSPIENGIKPGIIREMDKATLFLVWTISLLVALFEIFGVLFLLYYSMG
jgi:hypothetical protein